MSDGEAPDGIPPGRRLIRTGAATTPSFLQTLRDQLERLTWRTWIGDLRLKGRHPSRLLAVLRDPIPGDAARGQALRAGELTGFGAPRAVATLDLADATLRGDLLRYLHSFAWLGDLAAVDDAPAAAKAAQALAARWLARHGTRVDDVTWRAELCGRRLLALAAHAPLLLSSTDLVFRSRVLDAMARSARHLDRAADKAPSGVERVAGWCGVVVAGLVLPDGEARRAAGEAGLARALAAAGTGDGGVASRSPAALLEVIALLARVRAAYAARATAWPPALAEPLAAMAPALLATQLGDGGLAGWQGAPPIGAAQVAAVLAAAGLVARPLRQPRDWGYQRLAAGRTIVVLDAAPPPERPADGGGCASTLAFELSDGAERLIVSCGGATAARFRLGEDVARQLRTTAAHSTLTLADRNSTALRPDGTLGRGVEQVELARQESDVGSRVEASHDGYARRLGFVHRRQLVLSGDGAELRGEDVLASSGRRTRRGRRASAFAIRFHLGSGVVASVTGDGRSAMLRTPGGAIWQLRSDAAAIACDDSVWIDADNRPVPTQQLVIAGEAPPAGVRVGWVLTRARG